MDKPLFQRILQVGVVVSNLEASMQQYTNKYGIGPWAIYELGPDQLQKMIVHNQLQPYRMRIALTDLGGVELELIQPLDDGSIHAEFLREHGEGLHHLAFAVKDYDRTMELAKNQGLQVLQSGTWVNETFTYLSTQEDLGLIAEIYKRQPGYIEPKPDRVYPEGADS
jgi:catechol 2,3-dioxygenase-like lactoylglutathione lyase family enzyme